MAKWCVEVAVHVESPSESEARAWLFSVLDAGHRAMGATLGPGGAEVIASHRLDGDPDLPPDQRGLDDDELARNELARAEKIERARTEKAERTKKRSRPRR